jgi:hypothetical protein
MFAPLILFGGFICILSTMMLVLPQLSRSARLRRRAHKTPIRDIREGRRGELIRVRGIVHSSGSTLPIPFSDGQGVFHFTQLVDSANPGQTSTFTRGAQCGFFIDDGTGHARVPPEVKLELIGQELEGGGLDRNDPQVGQFLDGKADDLLFSKGGWVVWRQARICLGDEVVAWGRVVLEPEGDARYHQGHFRQEPQRIVLAPVEPSGPVVIEPLVRPSGKRDPER